MFSRSRHMRLLSVLSGLAMIASVCAEGPSAEQIDRQIDVLLAKMSVEEKLLQLASTFPNANVRLGIPQLQAGEALHGVCLPGATSYPQAIALAATWDPELLFRIGRAIGREGRALGMHQCFAPMLGLARDPRWGRVEESYGEDPWLVSRMAVAFINGVQGTGADRFGKESMICTPKHFVADGDSLRGGNAEAVEISEQTLRETAMIPFEAAVKEARTGSIMPAHHALNRIPCHVNTWLLRDVLRKEWGFDGFITSDYGDIAKNFNWDIASGHYVAPDHETAGKLSLEAGVDSELMGMYPWDSPFRTYGAQMQRGIREGRIPIAAVDQAVRNVLRAKFRLGLFGQPVAPECDMTSDPAVQQGKDTGNKGQKEFDPWAAAVRNGTPPGMKLTPRTGWETEVGSKAHAALALEAAEKEIVLLQNKGGLLPLDPSRIKSIAVIGPNAAEMVLGGYSTAAPPYFVSVLDGIKKMAGEKIGITHVKGCGLTASPQDDIPAAVEAANRADLAVVVVGTARSTMGENLDRASLDLTGAQQQLVESVHATGKPVVVVLINGGPLTIPWIKEHVPAILEAWYGGQETGTAVANVLFGKTNPGGKLPVTFPLSTGMVPCYYNALPPGGPRKYLEGKFSVLYPFGHGLSYTTFGFSKPELDMETIRPDGSATLKVRITNTGKRAGDEVVQMYVQHRYAATVRPEKELKGFQRISLAPGETREVALPVGFEQLKSWIGGKWTVEPGQYVLAVGPNSVDTQSIPLRVSK